MQIQWLGLASFKMQTTNSVIITDPYNDTTGYKMPKLKADIVIVSETDNKLANNTKRLSGNFFLISTAGEYEIKDTFVYGIPAKHPLYIIDEENITIAFLGVTAVLLNATQLERLEGVDILLLPISLYSKEQRANLISQIEPRVIIPYLYEKKEFAAFAKELGVKDTTAREKYMVKSKDLPHDETDIIILQLNQ